MENRNKSGLDRREFLKRLGAGAAVVSAAAVAGCAPRRDGGAVTAAGEIPTDRMTYRTCRL